MTCFTVPVLVVEYIPGECVIEETWTIAQKKRCPQTKVYILHMYLVLD